MKHVDAKLKFLRDYAKKKTIKPANESTKTMDEDLLMKVLPAPRIKDAFARESDVHQGTEKECWKVMYLVHSYIPHEEAVIIMTVKICKTASDRLRGVVEQN